MENRTQLTVAEWKAEIASGTVEVKWRFWSDFIRQVWNLNHKINSETRKQPVSLRVFIRLVVKFVSVLAPGYHQILLFSWSNSSLVWKAWENNLLFNFSVHWTLYYVSCKQMLESLNVCDICVFIVNVRYYFVLQWLLLTIWPHCIFLPDYSVIAIWFISFLPLILVFLHPHEQWLRYYWMRGLNTGIG